MTERDTRPAVLFVCVKNAGKSQMAAGLLRMIAGDAVQVHSAGTTPGNAINDLSAQVLAEVGIDITKESPKPVDHQLVRNVDVVVTLGREAHVDPTPALDSSAGILPTPPNAVSMASNACASSVTKSPPALRISLAAWRSRRLIALLAA